MKYLMVQEVRSLTLASPGKHQVLEGSIPFWGLSVNLFAFSSLQRLPMPLGLWPLFAILQPVVFHVPDSSVALPSPPLPPSSSVSDTLNYSGPTLGQVLSVCWPVNNLYSPLPCNLAHASDMPVFRELGWEHACVVCYSLYDPFCQGNFWLSFHFHRTCSPFRVSAYICSLFYSMPAQVQICRAPLPSVLQNTPPQHTDKHALLLFGAGRQKLKEVIFWNEKNPPFKVRIPLCNRVF